MTRKAWLAKMIGLSGWRGSVTIIGIGVISTAVKKMSLPGSLTSPGAPSETRGPRPTGGVSGVMVIVAPVVWSGSRPGPAAAQEAGVCRGAGRSILLDIRRSGDLASVGCPGGHPTDARLRAASGLAAGIGARAQ